MEVIKITPRGYCKGVVRAINLAKESLKKYPNQKITILGMLVHNKYVMEALQQKNIEMIDDKHKTREELLDEINEGVVIFTAHGIAPQVIEKAKKKGLICVDASCLDVVKTQQLVMDYLKKEYIIFYIGKKFHPEAEAILQLSKNIIFIENETSIPTNIQQKIFVTNQTTMSIFDIQKIFQAIKSIYPNAVIAEEICNATRIRQEAVVQAAKQNIDILYVVGDPNSNNSNRLAQIAHEHGIKKVYLINDVLDITHQQLSHCNKVAVTSGASTPTYLTNQVIQYLENYTSDATPPTPSIDQIL